MGIICGCFTRQKEWVYVWTTTYKYFMWWCVLFITKVPGTGLVSAIKTQEKQTWAWDTYADVIQLFSLLILLDRNGGTQKAQRCREKIFPETTAYKSNPSSLWTSPQQTWQHQSGWDVPVPNKVQERAVHPHKPFPSLVSRLHQGQVPTSRLSSW